MNETILCPITIVMDRYMGAYSKGKFTAWNLDPQEVPKEIDADDSTCRNFWDSKYVKKYVICGKGDTPNEAYQDLNKKFASRFGDKSVTAYR